MEINSILPVEERETDAIRMSGLRPFSVFNSQTGRMRPLAVIAAVGRDGAIGRDGDLVWHISADLKRFRSLTMGHPVIMGRKTWESLPKLLPGRRNIIVTTRSDFRPEGAETASSLEEAVEMTQGGEIPFVIGGGQIYRQAMPMATHLYLTLVDCDCPEADIRFPESPVTGDPSNWRLDYSSEWETDRKLGVRYRFLNYIRIE